MSSPPLFSALIANYNNAKYISACLDSIIAQTYTNLEIVIVDDASTDHSLVVIAPYIAKYANIKLFKNEQNQGVGYTKKRCIAEAKGEICGFVDPDDAITVNAVLKMVEAHNQHQSASLIYSNYYECDEQLAIKKAYQSAQVINGLLDFFNDEGKIGHFASFKRSAYLQTRGLNTTLKRAVDQDLYLKLYDVGNCIHIDESIYHYRIHEGGLSTKAQADFAYYWFWVIKMLRAQEKGLNLEQDFTNTFARVTRLKHWIKIDKLFRKSPLYRLLKIFK